MVVLAFAGLLVSLNLAFFQYHLTRSVWDPLFGDGSQAVLTSSFSRALPVHDAALGCLAYALEATLELAGGNDRWRRRPWLVLLLAATATAMAVTALGLVLLQVLVVHAFCTLCLVSAAISLTVPLILAHEVLATLREVRQARRYGVPWARSLRGLVRT